MAHDQNDGGFGGFDGFGDADLSPAGGFGDSAPDDGRISRPATAPSDGFGAAVPATAPADGFGDDAPTDPNGAGFGDDNEGDKPGDEATPAPEHGLRADGMDPDALATIANVLGEHEVDSEVGQELLDKVLPVLAERRAEQWQSVEQGWIDQKAAESAKDPTIRPRVDLALSVLPTEVADALRGEVYIESPTLYRALAAFGAFVQKATRQDRAVPGMSPLSTPAPRFAASDTSSRAFAAGFGGGGF